MKRISLIFCSLTSCTINTVYPTERGIVLDDKTNSSSYIEILQPGTYYIPIYDDFVAIDVLPKNYTDEFNCLTRDEKPVKVKTSMICFPIPDQVDKLFEMYENKYYEILIVPELRATVRKSVSEYDSIGLIHNREIITDLINSKLQNVYNNHHAAMNDFKIDWLN